MSDRDDPPRVEAVLKIIWMLLPFIILVATLIMSANAERQSQEKSEQWQAQALNTITIDSSSANVTSRKSLTDPSIFICRFTNSDIPHRYDYYVHFKTEESVAFVNSSGRTVSLTRVDLSAAGEQWEVEAFKHSFPADIGANRTDEWQLYGTFTAGQETEALTQRKSSELTTKLVKFIWKFTLDSGTTITLETKPREPFIFPLVDDCSNVSDYFKTGGRFSLLQER